TTLIVTFTYDAVSLHDALPISFVAVIEQVPVAEITCSFPPTIEQAVEEPASKETAPVPEPPEVLINASGSPYVAEAGPVTVKVRSEEQTTELESRAQPICRLLT